MTKNKKSKTVQYDLPNETENVKEKRCRESKKFHHDLSMIVCLYSCIGKQKLDQFDNFGYMVCAHKFLVIL